MKTGFMVVTAIAAIFSMRAEADVQAMVPAHALLSGKQIIPMIDIGTSPTLPKEVSGDGAYVPLSDALRMIMQFSGWHAFIEPGVDRDAPVFWHGGVPWTDALKNVAIQAGVTAEIDWAAKTVTITPGKPVPPRMETNVVAATTIGAAPSETDLPQPVWKLTHADGTIKAALARWAKKADWQVSWEMPDGEDFRFDQTAAYRGSFEAAVRHLAISLKSSQMPIKAIFYQGNRVVRIVPLSSGAEQ